MELFKEEKELETAPLAYRMRPGNLDEFVGQGHILGKEKLLRRAILADRFTSLIFYGPPGTGKTALAYIIANLTKSRFESLNAVTSGVAEIRRLIKEADLWRKREAKRTICFIDELHRFNKAQQDALLPSVEDGTIILIGATTQNPFFYINAALASRSQIFEFKPLEKEEIRTVLIRALEDKERGLKEKVKVEEEALEHLITYADGDLRRALNGLELAALTTEPDGTGLVHICLAAAKESIQKKGLVYEENDHYDTISAFIKSMRGSDPDAALYWLAKMLVAGEDPRFIARRIIISAAEDVGNADPQALVVAVSALSAVDFVGMPEAKIPLAQAAIYIACAPKSNASYLGIEKALKDVESQGLAPVPMHLREASYKQAARLGYGKGYKYPHHYQNHYVKQAYLPFPKSYYQPSDSGYEAKIKDYLLRIRSSKQ